MPRRIGRDPTKRKYHAHKQNAKLRGVKFLLTFEEWYRIWLDSGHWENRGVRKGQYVTARFGDKGPYAVGNVRIVTVGENLTEMWANPRTRDKLINSLELKATRRRNALGNKNCVGKQNSLGKRWKFSPEALARRNAKRKATLESKNA